jgi:hypothetical protein
VPAAETADDSAWALDDVSQSSSDFCSTGASDVPDTTYIAIQQAWANFRRKKKLFKSGMKKAGKYVRKPRFGKGKGKGKGKHHAFPLEDGMPDFTDEAAWAAEQNKRHLSNEIPTGWDSAKWLARTPCPDCGSRWHRTCAGKQKGGGGGKGAKGGRGFMTFMTTALFAGASALSLGPNIHDATCCFPCSSQFDQLLPFAHDTQFQFVFGLDQTPPCSVQFEFDQDADNSLFFDCDEMLDEVESFSIIETLLVPGDFTAVPQGAMQLDTQLFCFSELLPEQHLSAELLERFAQFEPHMQLSLQRFTNNLGFETPRVIQHVFAAHDVDAYKQAFADVWEEYVVNGPEHVWAGLEPLDPQLRKGRFSKFNSNTRRRFALMLDTGAPKSATGQTWLNEFISAFDLQSYVVYTPYRAQLSGIGSGSAEVKHKLNLPIGPPGLPTQRWETQQLEGVGKNVPPLLGLESMYSMKGIIDIQQCTYSIVVEKDRRVALQCHVVNGHVMLPIDWGGKAFDLSEDTYLNDPLGIKVWFNDTVFRN